MLIAVLAFGACSHSDKERAADGAPDAPAAQRPASTTPPQRVDTAATEPVVHVALDGEGLRLVDPRTGSTRLLEFGSDEKIALDALIMAWGVPAERTGQPDCAAEPPTSIRWTNGLGVLMQEGKFTGWSASAPRQPEAATSRAVQTMSGVGAGTSRMEVESVYAIRVSQTTLGTEFEAGGMHGVFADSTAGAPVEALWAGFACVYR